MGKKKTNKYFQKSSSRGRQRLEIKPAVAWDSWRSNSAASSTDCFCSSTHFLSFVVALYFKSSLHHRFTTRWKGCRESCSGVNWSVSARLKSADGVTCKSEVSSSKLVFWTSDLNMFECMCLRKHGRLRQSCVCIEYNIHVMSTYVNYHSASSDEKKCLAHVF